MSTALPKTYRACIYDSPGKISTKVVDLDMPEPGAAQVLIKLYVNPLHVFPFQSFHLTFLSRILTQVFSAHTPVSATPISAS